MIVFLCRFIYLLRVMALIHQIFTWELISDPCSDDRLWCVVKFPRAWLETFNTVMNLLTTIVPFLVNLFSAIVILINFFRTKQKAVKKRYLSVLKIQIKEHQDLIVNCWLVFSLSNASNLNINSIFWLHAISWRLLLYSIPSLYSFYLLN